MAKKLISCLIVLTLVLGLLTAVTVSAATNLKISAGDKTVKAGQDVTVQFAVTANCTISYFAFNATWDTSKLKYKSDEKRAITDDTVIHVYENDGYFEYQTLCDENANTDFQDTVILEVTFTALSDFSGTSITTPVEIVKWADADEAYVDQNYDGIWASNVEVSGATITIQKSNTAPAGTDNTNSGDKDNSGEANKPSADPKDCIIMTINDVKIWKFTEWVSNDVPPIIVNDRTMLPSRFVAEALGAKVDWNDAMKTVTIVKGDISIILVIGSDIAIINGEEVKFDAPAFIQNDRTYTPTRLVAEALGATVDWDGDARKVTITR